MNCPKCGGKTKVRDLSNGPDEILRERQCLECSSRIYTIEYEVERDDSFNAQWTEYHRTYVRNRANKKR